MRIDVYQCVYHPDTICTLCESCTYSCCACPCTCRASRDAGVIINRSTPYASIRTPKTTGLLHKNAETSAYGEILRGSVVLFNQWCEECIKAACAPRSVVAAPSRRAVSCVLAVMMGLARATFEIYARAQTGQQTRERPRRAARVNSETSQHHSRKRALARPSSSAAPP